MRAYIYNDEDNAPMVDMEDPVLKYTTYSSYEEMIAVERDKIPFDEAKHDNGCWNCSYYDGDRCMAHWNNADPDYYNPETDDKDPDDWCPDWEKEAQM